MNFKEKIAMAKILLSAKKDMELPVEFPDGDDEEGNLAWRAALVELENEDIND